MGCDRMGYGEYLRALHDKIADRVEQAYRGLVADDMVAAKDAYFQRMDEIKRYDPDAIWAKGVKNTKTYEAYLSDFGTALRGEGYSE